MESYRSIRREQTKERIISEAIKSINESGIEKLNFKRIAENLNYSSTALYKYFKNKQELIDEVKIEGEKRAIAYVFKAKQKDLEADELLLEVTDRLLKWAKKNSNLFMVTYANKKESKPQDKKLSENSPMFNKFSKIIKERYEDGDLKLPDDFSFNSFLTMLIYLIYGISIARVVFDTDVPASFDKNISLMLKSLYKMFI